MQVLNWISKLRERVLSNKILVAAIPVLIWLLISCFFYKKMIDKQVYYILSKMRDQEKYYYNIIKTSQNLSNFIINNNQSIRNSTAFDTQIPSENTDNINFDLLLLNPLYESITTNQRIVNQTNLDFIQSEFDFNIARRKISQKVNRDKAFDLINQYSYIVPADKYYRKFDTITITFSLPAMVMELNKLFEEEYFLLPTDQIPDGKSPDLTEMSLSGHRHQRVSDTTCRLLGQKIEALFTPGMFDQKYFTELIKLDHTYYNAIFLPVFSNDDKFAGYIYSYSIDGFYWLYFLEFLRRVGIATLGIVVIFLLYYRNYANEIILSRQNIAIREDQKKLKIAKEKAEDANMIKSEFLANMSHEIRTPMNTVLGFTELLSNQISDNQQKKYLSAISSGTKNLLVLINDILDLSKIEAGRMKILYEPANPSMIFKEIESIFIDKVIDKNLQMTVKVDPSLPKYLLIDEIRLRQIMFNLIGNAIKFTQNGFVNVSVHAIPVKGKQNKVDLVIEVEDTGIGIPEKYHDEIFDAFQQQDGRMTKKYGGTGLGLSISRKLADLMNGDISMKSKEDEGTTFTLTLKMIEIVHLEEKSPVKNLGQNHKKQRNIIFKESVVLIVDDVDHNRFLIREYLKNSNLYVHEAVNGKEAIDTIRLIHPDLVLMDIRMPVMDGIEATEIIKNDKELSDIIVIALTASVMEEEISEIKKAGFDDFLRKPIKLRELASTIAKYLSHEQISVEEKKKSDRPKLKQQEIPSGYLDDILPVLEIDLFNKWNIVKNGGFIDEISNFGKNIKELGERFSINKITDYGIDLCESAENFDVNNMKKILNSFPGLVESIKKMR